MSATATSPRCPSCNKPVELRASNPSFPFCGSRCRAVDLGKWLGEEYRIPSKPLESDDDESMPRATEDEA